MTLRFERGLTLRDALDILTGERDDEILNQVESIYVAPPEPSVLTDEDSADEDEGGLADNLSGKQLMADAEIKLSNNTIISNIPKDGLICNLEDEILSMSNDFLMNNTEARDTQQPDQQQQTTQNNDTQHTKQSDLEGNIPVNNNDPPSTGENPQPLNTNTTENANRPKSNVGLLSKLMSEKKDEIKAKKKKIPIHKTWIDGDLEPSSVRFPQADFMKYRDFSASELFELFFDEEVFDIFLRETTNYALFRNCPDPNITKNEIKCFIGILLFTGYHSLPGKRYYWASQPDVHVEFISNAMRRNRFETIMKFIHCADNNKIDVKDKLWKLRPLLNKVKQNCLQHFVPVQNLSYDESMIQYFGRHGCKQHIKGKPIRFGFKVWCINTVCGYLVNFDIYQGKSLGMPTEYEELFGKSSSPLVKLIDDFHADKTNLPYRFFFDNLFTNTYLLKYLQGLGYNGVGTMREDRLPKSCNLTEKKEMKNLPRGYFESSLCKEDGILICKWHDNGVVSIASNCHGVEPVATVKRYSQEQKRYIQVQRPAVFGEYNRNMGGTDKMDEHVGNYRIGVRSKKWYWPILTWLIDVCVQNAWQLRRNSGDNQPQLDFRRELVQCYITRYGVPSKGPGRPLAAKRSLSSSRVSDDIRYDGLNHLVIATPEKKKKRCAGEGCSSIIRTMCKKCNVGLCIECFSIFHEVTY